MDTNPEVVPHRWKVRDLCLLVAFAAVVCASAMHPLTWQLIRVREVPIMAQVRFAMFWVGIFWVVFRAKTSAGRFFGLAAVLAAIQLVLVPLPRYDVASMPDIPGTFTVGSLLAAFAFLLVGIVVQERAPRTSSYVPRNHRDAKP